MNSARASCNVLLPALNTAQARAKSSPVKCVASVRNFSRASLPLSSLRRPLLAGALTLSTTQGFRKGGTRSRGLVCNASAIEDVILQKNSENAVVVYSKTWCPFCSQVKMLLSDMNVEPFVVELDRLHEGDEIQGTLTALTGQRTVPSVFIGGKHIGGCDDTVSLKRSGELAKLLEAAGAL